MASGKGNNCAIGFLEMIYQAVQSADFANLIENSSTSPLTSLYVSLHNANPGATGNQATSETTYTNYARVAVARTTGGWTITSESITNAAAITFAACGVTGDTLTYVGVGTNPTAGQAGVLLWFGQLTSPLVVSSGITPSFAIGQLEITEG